MSPYREPAEPSPPLEDEHHNCRYCSYAQLRDERDDQERFGYWLFFFCIGIMFVAILFAIGLTTGAIQ